MDLLIPLCGVVTPLGYWERDQQCVLVVTQKHVGNARDRCGGMLA